MIRYYFHQLKKLITLLENKVHKEIHWQTFWMMLVIKKLQSNAYLVSCIIYELAAKKVDLKAQRLVLTPG